MYSIIKKLSAPWEIYRIKTIPASKFSTAPLEEEREPITNVRLIVYRLWCEVNPGSADDSLVTRSHLELVFNQNSDDNNVQALINESDQVAIDVQSQQFRVVGTNKNNVAIFFYNPTSNDPYLMENVQKLEINADTANPNMFQFGVVTVGVSTHIQDADKPDTTMGRWDFPYPIPKDQIPKNRYQLIRKANDGQGTGSIDRPAQGLSAGL